MKIQVDKDHLTNASVWRLLTKALMTKHKGMRPGETMPRFEAEWSTIRADKTQLARYRDVCGFPSNGVLPILYPYVLTSGLQIGIMMDSAFPLKPLGTVHLRNNVLLHRPIREDEELSVTCFTGESRPVKSGLEFDMHVVVSADGERVWENTSSYLSRGKYGQPDETRPKSTMPELADTGAESVWRVPADMGRCYASISGDYNPIHVSTFLAKLFGFSRAIVHGMWSAATCAARVPQLPDGTPLRYDVVFKGPIFLGSQVRLISKTSTDAHRFDLFCEKNPKPCLCGLMYTQPGGTVLVS